MLLLPFLVHLVQLTTVRQANGNVDPLDVERQFELFIDHYGKEYSKARNASVYNERLENFKVCALLLAR